MTIEEKAKAYDKALSKAREYHFQGQAPDKLAELESIFPQLRESENERIRKELIQFLTDVRNISESGRTSWAVRKEDVEMCNGFIAYLEKQKENPKSAEEVLAKAGLKPYKDGNQWCILAGDNIQEGICGFGDTIEDALYQFLMEVLEKQKELNHDGKKWIYQNDYHKVLRSWYMEGYQDREHNQEPKWIIRTGEDGPKYLPNLKYGQKLTQEQKPVECINIEELAKHIKAEFESFRNLLKKKGIDYQPTDVYWTDYARLFVSSVKKLQKPAEWSKEDERIIKDAIYALEEVGGYPYTVKGLKSLHPSCKLSKEDKKILYAIEFHVGQLDSGETINGFSSSDMLRVLKSITNN